MRGKAVPAGNGRSFRLQSGVKVGTAWGDAGHPTSGEWTRGPCREKWANCALLHWVWLLWEEKRRQNDVPSERGRVLHQNGKVLIFDEMFVADVCRSSILK